MFTTTIRFRVVLASTLSISSKFSHHVGRYFSTCDFYHVNRQRDCIFRSIYVANYGGRESDFFYSRGCASVFYREIKVIMWGKLYRCAGRPIWKSRVSLKQSRVAHVYNLSTQKAEASLQYAARSTQTWAIKTLKKYVNTQWSRE